MKSIQPTYSIVPIVRSAPEKPITEVLGTGFIVGTKEKLFIVTARHVFDSNPLSEGEKYAYTFRGEKRVTVWLIPKIYGSESYDIAFFEVEKESEAVPLSFSKQEPAFNDDVFCYEYSTSRIEKTPAGGTHVSFEPLAHKGNVMRYYDSTFPESKPTPSFLTSFPALQGASGAPVMAGTKQKHIYVAGMIVANQETYLLPAQTVKIQDGENYKEETSYFLPLGKALQASVITEFLESMNVEIEFVD